MLGLGSPFDGHLEILLTRTHLNMFWKMEFVHIALMIILSPTIISAMLERVLVFLVLGKTK